VTGAMRLVLRLAKARRTVDRVSGSGLVPILDPIGSLDPFVDSQGKRPPESTLTVRVAWRAKLLRSPGATRTVPRPLGRSAS